MNFTSSEMIKIDLLFTKNVESEARGPYFMYYLLYWGISFCLQHSLT